MMNIVVLYVHKFSCFKICENHTSMKRHVMRDSVKFNANSHHFVRPDTLCSRRRSMIRLKVICTSCASTSLFFLRLINSSTCRSENETQPYNLS